MNDRTPPNRYQSVLIACSQCNAHGALAMEPAEGAQPARFVGIVGNFHNKIGRTVPDRTVIACDQRDETYGILPATEKTF
jgi:hypothetical protein